jgi:hypothetical protein
MGSAKQKCEHDPCKCMIDAEDVYCSPQCERRADMGHGPPCRCGHHDCETSVGVEVVDGAAPA